MDKDQKLRWSKAEIGYIRDTFGGSDEFLYQLRNFFHGFLAVEEIKSRVDENLLKMLKKLIIADPEADAPITQLSDLYMGLSKIQEMNPAVASLHIEAKDLQDRYLRAKVRELEGDKNDFLSLGQLKGNMDVGSEEKSDEDRYTGMLAYINILNYIETRFYELKTLAGMKDETEEERIKRAEANSNK